MVGARCMVVPAFYTMHLLCAGVNQKVVVTPKTLFLSVPAVRLNNPSLTASIQTISTFANCIRA